MRDVHRILGLVAAVAPVGCLLPTVLGAAPVQPPRPGATDTPTPVVADQPASGSPGTRAWNIASSSAHTANPNPATFLSAIIVPALDTRCGIKHHHGKSLRGMPCLLTE